MITGNWRNASDGSGADLDVILTLPPGSLPNGTHLRIYPRRFVEISAIAGDQPSFVRADGGAAIASAGTPSRVLLTNPFNLTIGAVKPNPARLEVDIVVTSRTGQRRLFSVVGITLGSTPESWSSNLAGFGGQAFLSTPAMATLLTAFSTQAIAPTPLFGIPRSLTPPPGNPSNIADLARRLASETQPRQGPRLPTQARFETILALGTSPTTSGQHPMQQKQKH
jgi:hypothetical protein